MIRGGQVTVPQRPFCIKQIIFNAKVFFDGELKMTYLIKRGGKVYQDSSTTRVNEQYVVPASKFWHPA
jgi:hypothetical protein